MTLDQNPTSIGKYRLIASLGAGGMAQVFLAVATGPAGFNKLLVLKLLRTELAQDDKFRLMFLDEAKLAARLNHPNVVQTYEVGEEAGRTFLAMEYLEGQPWSTVLRKLGRPQLPLEAHVKLLADMLAGLHHAHELTDYDGAPLRVVHRDVSPPNVMVTYEGVVKLMDFGIAAAANASQVTEAGTFKGKAAYAAPEQIRGDKVDRRADIFAVGVMLWEALAGRRISEGKQDLQMMHQRIAGMDPAINEVVPAAPPELLDICRRAMREVIDERYSSAREMQQALLGWLHRQPPVDLGGLIAASFQEEQARLRLLVEEAMRRSREDTAPTSLPQLATSMPPTPSHGSQVSVAHTTSQDPTPQLPTPRRGSLAAPGVIGVLLLGGLLATLRSRETPAPTASPSPSSPLTTASAPALQASAPASASAAEPSPGVRVEAPPASAEPINSGARTAVARAASTPAPDKTGTAEPVESGRPGTKNSKKSKRAIDDSDPYAR